MTVYFKILNVSNMNDYMLLKQCSIRLKPIYERAALNKRKQGSKESAFVTALYTLARHCNSGER